MAKSALIVKLGAIGDVVMLLPAAHALHLRGYAIHWVCGRAVLPLLQLYPWINPIPTDEHALFLGSPAAKLRALWRLWRQIVGPIYDLVAILYYSPAYRVLTLPVRARRKLMLSHRHRARTLVPGRHHTGEFARILLDLPDDERILPLPPVPPPALPRSPLHPKTMPRVLLAPAGARNLLREDVLRRWPAENYVALTQSLLRQGIEVILIGGPDDAWIEPAFAGLPITSLIGKLSLPQTLALLADGDILVTHDTGPLHLAGLTEVAILAIFGPTDPRGRLPQRPGALAIWGGEGFPCRPCYDGRNYAPCHHNGCMSQVTPHFVLDRLRLMLAERSAGRLAPPLVISPPHSIAEGRLP